MDLSTNLRFFWVPQRWESYPYFLSQFDKSLQEHQPVLRFSKSLSFFLQSVEKEDPALDFKVRVKYFSEYKKMLEFKFKTAIFRQFLLLKLEIEAATTIVEYHPVHFVTQSFFIKVPSTWPTYCHSYNVAQFMFMTPLCGKYSWPLIVKRNH